MTEFKGINSESAISLYFINVSVQLRRRTNSITSDDDINTCTMKEVKNGGVASEFQHKNSVTGGVGRNFVSVDSLEIHYMKNNMN